VKAPDLAIRGGTVVLETGPADADVVIRGERIAALTAPGFGPVAGETLDARGLHVLPGLIDLHVHFRDPGLTHKEDFATGTRAALAGGFTTVFDMPNVQPATATAGAFRAKAALAASKALCDFGLWAGGTDSGAYRAFADLGAVGIKIYQQQLARIPGNAYFNELFCTEEDALHGVFRGAAEAGLPVCLHAGAPGIEAAERERLIRAGRNRMRDLNALRRIPAAVLGTAKCVHLAEAAGARLHVAHISLSGPECLDLVRRAKKRGARVTAECPPVALTLEDLDRVGPLGLPFALPAGEIPLYWEAMAEGTIDAIATDHAPHTAEEKRLGSKDVWKAPTGYPALEVSLAIGLERVRSGSLGLARLVELMSAAPAKIAGIHPQKGSIRIGADADFTLVDLKKDWTVRAGDMESRAGWSPFEGRRFKGRAVVVVRRGKVAMRDREILARPGDGKFVAPRMRDSGTE
jgi:dihydroorotase (multifunctional complex type)